MYKLKTKTMESIYNHIVYSTNIYISESIPDINIKSEGYVVNWSPLTKRFKFDTVMDEFNRVCTESSWVTSPDDTRPSHCGLSRRLCSHLFTTKSVNRSTPLFVFDEIEG
jgi:hypothetical protein